MMRLKLIRDMLTLLRVLDSQQAKPIKDIAEEAGMQIRAAYRWLTVFEQEGLVEKFDSAPARFRLRPDGVRLKRSLKR